MDARRCRITTDPIDPAALLAGAASPSDGAALIFLGVVRNSNNGRRVEGLEYEAFAPMAEAEMERIAWEASDRWDTGAVSIVHRVGALAVGEVSVAIVVASPHRGDAYEASRYAIEELKKRVPIWKREEYVGAPSAWLDGHTPRPGEVILD